MSSAATSNARNNAPSGRTILGHPPGLFILFSTELFERFCYYGMRAVLVLYLTNYFRWTQADASRVYKWYTSLVYLTPLLGGYLADRYLGNKLAVIIGAVTMAVGEFMLAYSDLSVFYIGLGLLIIGNGFFKPNMSVQVGRLYPPGDSRRDVAYTIFYMGINAGAFMSPLVCGTLAEKVSYSWGFLAAGIGMLLSLVIYLVGQPWVLELAQETAKPTPTAAEAAEAERADQPVYGWLSSIAPGFFAVLGTLAVVAGPVWYMFDHAALDNAIFAVLIGLSIGAMALVLFGTRGKERDKSIAILALMIFVIAFWFAFEQAGNVLNVWADKYTDRYVLNFGPTPLPATALPAATQAMPAPAGNMASWEMPASWFQSVNPLLIVVFAPIAAGMWTWLSRRGGEPSTAIKMAMGVFLCGLSFVAMVGGAMSQDKPSQSSLAALTPNVLSEGGKLAFKEHEDAKELVPYLAGKLTYDAGGKTLHMSGVLSDLERDRVLGDSAPDAYHKVVEELAKKSEAAAKAGKNFEVGVPLSTLPNGFDLAWTTLRTVRYDADKRMLMASQKLEDREKNLLLLAAADPPLRAALWDIFKQTWAYRGSMFWLVVSYVLATMGELCLSPVGLSMVSKLAPQKFATLLMGLWLCNSFFANFLAGFMGELWGKIPPVSFFAIFVGVCLALAVVLWFISKPIRRLMHGVH